MSRNNLRRVRPHVFQINECHAYHFHALHPYGVLPRVESVETSQSPENGHPGSPILRGLWRTLFARAVRRQTVPVVVERLREHDVPVRAKAVYGWISAAVRPNVVGRGWAAEGLLTLASLAAFAGFRSPLLAHYGECLGMGLSSATPINESTRARMIETFKVVTTAAKFLNISGGLCAQDSRAAGPGVMATRDGRCYIDRIPRFFNAREAGE